MGPNPVTSVLTRKGKFGHGDIQGEHIKTGIKDSDAAARQRAPKIASNRLELGRG